MNYAKPFLTLLFLCLLASKSQAAIVTIEADYTITSAPDFAGMPDVGDIYRISFSYSNTTPASPYFLSPSYALYFDGFTDVDLSAMGGSGGINDSILADTSNYIGVANDQLTTNPDFTTGPIIDGFGLFWNFQSSNISRNSPLTLAELDVLQVAISLTDLTQSVFSDIDLPLSVDLDDFSESVMSLSVLARPKADSGDGDSILSLGGNIEGNLQAVSISSSSDVPAPNTLALLSLGVLTLLRFKRRVHKRG